MNGIKFKNSRTLKLLDSPYFLFFNFKRLASMFHYPEDVSVFLCNSFQDLKKCSKDQLIPDWVIGCNYSNNVFVLEPYKWKYNSSSLDRVIMHEITHVVVNSMVFNCPIWLNEGLALWYANQVEEFDLKNVNFIDPYVIDYSENMYLHSAFIIKKIFESYPEKYLIETLLKTKRWIDNKVFGLESLRKLFD